jgi:hypothetical protein
MRTACVNVSWRNIRRVRRPKPDDLRSRSRSLFKFTLREEFSRWANQRIARAEVTIREELSKPQRLKSMMNGNNAQTRVPTLKDLYGPKQSSLPWEEHQAEIVRFWTDSGDCWGFLFHHVSGTYFSANEQRLLIDWPLGTIVVTGPKTLEFYEQFSNHRATLLRADGKDILSVRMHTNSETQAERGAETITQAKEWEDLSP